MAKNLYYNASGIGVMPYFIASCIWLSLCTPQSSAPESALLRPRPSKPTLTQKNYPRADPAFLKSAPWSPSESVRKSNALRSRSPYVKKDIPSVAGSVAPSRTSISLDTQTLSGEVDGHAEQEDKNRRARDDYKVYSYKRKKGRCNGTA